MRKIFLMALLCFGLSLSAAFPQEAKPQLSMDGDDGDLFFANFPVLYSYEKQQWVSSSPGIIFTSGDQQVDFTLPYLKKRPTPIRYPRWALSRDWQGDLLLAIEIRPDGTVGRWKIMESTGFRLLDDAAVNAVRKWRFEPAKQKGRPIVSCIQIPVHFVMKPE